MDLQADVTRIAVELIGIPSVSRNESAIADAVERALGACSHLEVIRDGNTVIARTQFGHAERVILGGHLDTVPPAANEAPLLLRVGEAAPDTGEPLPEDRLYGLGACDMKGGAAVELKLAATVTAPTRDITYVFYECEEIEAQLNGLRRIADTRPELLEADFAVLMEPSNAVVEAGCQGTMRIDVRTHGRRAHTARAWMGENAIHALHPILERLHTYQPRTPVIDGLQYREGLQAVSVSGGVAGNVVPDATVITINYRFAPDRSPAEAEAHLREVFAGYDVTVVDVAAGALPGLSHPAAAAFVAATGGSAEPKFGWTDVARFSALGIPAVNFGPANPALAHTQYEYVPVADLHRVETQLRTWLTS